MNMCQNLRSMTWREILILDKEKIQMGVNVKQVCLYLRENISVATGGILQSKNLRLKMLTV